MRTAESGRTAVKIARDFAPDLVVLDVMLPDLDGFEVHRRLADRRDRPAGAVPDRPRRAPRTASAGSRSGADDYVAKPFSLEELVARVRAVLRRTRARARTSTGRCASRTCELDEDAREVRRGRRWIELTPTEFNLLRYLLVNAGRVVSQGADPRPRVALRLRRRLQHRRDLHQLPAQEGRPGEGTAADPHRARVRLRPARRRGAARVAARPPDRDHPRAGGRGPDRRRGGDSPLHSRLPDRPARPAADASPPRAAQPRRPRSSRCPAGSYAASSGHTAGCCGRSATARSTDSELATPGERLPDAATRRSRRLPHPLMGPSAVRRRATGPASRGTLVVGASRCAT